MPSRHTGRFAHARAPLARDFEPGLPDTRPPTRARALRDKILREGHPKRSRASAQLMPSCPAVPRSAILRTASDSPLFVLLHEPPGGSARKPYAKKPGQV